MFILGLARAGADREQRHPPRRLAQGSRRNEHAGELRRHRRSTSNAATSRSVDRSRSWTGVSETGQRIAG